jgi:hypothetical protein
MQYLGSDRATFLLREMDERTTQDICSVLGLTSSNVFVLLHRARLALRQCLELRWFERKKRRKKGNSTMALLFPSCAETARRLSRAQEQPLGVGERVGVWISMCFCRFCRRYRRQLMFLRRAARAFRENLSEVSQAQLPAEARRKIMDRLIQENQ